jgi:hypothetical protein
MKKSLILSILGLILINLPAFADASLGGGEETKLRKQWCNSQRNTYECRNLSSGEECMLNETTKCY